MMNGMMMSGGMMFGMGPIVPECASLREASAKLMMTENAVRFVLHRGLSNLAGGMRSFDANRLRDTDR